MGGTYCWVRGVKDGGTHGGEGKIPLAQVVLTAGVRGVKDGGKHSGGHETPQV